MYQVIVVQLFPEADDGKAYVERWVVRLNGNTKNEISVDFQGFAEQVSLVFGEDNCVCFDPVHVDCLQTQCVPVRNLSRHSVQFEYLPHEIPKELCIEQMCGIIQPNETVFHAWNFAPDQLRCYEFDISCCLRAEIGGRNSVVQIEVCGNSMEGCLMAIPEDLDFGLRVYKESSEMEFKIFNFSSVSIHFLLVCCPSKSLEIMKNPEKDMKITPSTGTVTPGKGEKITIVLTPTQVGFYELTIKYFMRPSWSADASIPLSKPIDLCTVKCTCYLPTLQIKDLLYKAETNKDVSKIFLWESLCIDELNSALKDLEPFQETIIGMIVPLVNLNKNEKFIIKLLLKNHSPKEASWCLKKRRICYCDDPAVNKKPAIKFNPRGECLYCVPDKSCTIQPKKISLQPNETDIITIEINSNTLKDSGIFWDLNIGEERHIILNIKLESSIIRCKPCLEFKNTYIGKCTSMRYKATWLYNNTECESEFSVDTTILESTNKKNYGVIFKCLNPKGIIPEYTRIPVFFGFCPNRFGNFTVKVTIKVGEKESVLTIEADSNCAVLPPRIGHKTCPASDTFISSDIFAYFNHNYAIIPPLPTHGKATSIIMIHNHHQQDVLYYEWKNYEVSGIIKIQVEPKRGLIKPQSLLTFLIIIHGGMYECTLDIDLFCEFINVCERRVAEKKKAEQDKIKKQMEHEFTITEKGIIVPKPMNFEPIKEPSTLCKTLTLKIEISNFQDDDIKTDYRNELQSIPAAEIPQNIVKCDNNISSELINMSSQILECMIWDIVNSQSFDQSLKEMFFKTHDLKYTQLPINAVKRKQQRERIDWIPRKRCVEDILHTMISMIVHEEFNLETSHFSHPPDVRQISYQKVYTANQ